MAVTTITIEGDAQVLTPNAISVPPSHDAAPLSYTIADAVQATGISERQFRRYIADGALTVRKNGKAIIILHDELQAFLRSLPVARTEG